MATLFEKAMEARSGAAGGAAPDPSVVASQAALLAVSSGLRYWSELASLCTGRNAVLARTLSAIGKDVPEAERRRMAADLQGLARDVGDLALREAHRFQSELEVLASCMTPDATAPADRPPPRRYARAKP
ncbi:MAG: hypothetical protein WBQ75_14850 [Acetobacteraceae bacterium]